ncbi:MAG: uridine kinase [Myxococcales bacterium]|nr:uridine kinase [Myxococcales bacterium]
MAAPLLIGIAGGTGSGKTTISQRIASALPPHLVTTLQHDSYYRDRQDISFEERSMLNFDHPEALETELLVRHLRALKQGKPVDVPIYDFQTHSRRKDTTRATATPVIIVEGILVFADIALRSLFDIKIFVDTDADIRVFRRIRRDMEQRGRTFSSVRDQYYGTVRPMHLEYVEPSKRWADMIIPEGGRTEVPIDLVVTKARSVLGN